MKCMELRGALSCKSASLGAAQTKCIGQVVLKPLREHKRRGTTLPFRNARTHIHTLALAHSRPTENFCGRNPSLQALLSHCSNSFLSFTFTHLLTLKLWILSLAQECVCALYVDSYARKQEIQLVVKMEYKAKKSKIVQGPAVTAKCMLTCDPPHKIPDLSNFHIALMINYFYQTSKGITI